MDDIKQRLAMAISAELSQCRRPTRVYVTQMFGISLLNIMFSPGCFIGKYFDTDVYIGKVDQEREILVVLE